MRSNEELMKGILERKAVYRTRKQLRQLRITGVGLGMLLIFSLIIAPGIRGNAIPTQMARSTLGATILGPEAGGYVIVALLAFSLGVVVATVIRKKKDKDIR